MIHHNTINPLLLAGAMSNNGTSTGSNDVDLDASWQTNLIACAAATWAIAAVFVALRFYLRGHMLHVLGREDWMILVALFFSAAYSIGYIVDAHFGFGKHAAALSPATLSIVTEVSWIFGRHRNKCISREGKKKQDKK